MELRSTPSSRESRPGRQPLLWSILLGGVLVVVCLMVVGAELGARYYERHRTRPPDFFPSIYYPHRHMRYGLIPNLDYYGWFTINSHGFRGREVSTEKKPGVVRIVCLGGSTTFDLGSIGKDLPWPEVLENRLRQQLGSPSLEVLNLGTPGASSLDSLVDLQTRALAFQPDLLVVYQGHNDVIYSVFSARPDTSGLFPDEDVPRSGFVRWLSSHSLLFAKRWGRLVLFLDRPNGLLSFGSRQEASEPERTRAVQQGVADFTANMKSIAAIGRANGIVLALPQIILPFPPGDDPSGHCSACDGLSEAYGGLPIGELGRTIAQYDHALEQIGTGEGLHYLPTAGWVPSADRYYHESLHFGPEGSVRMGEKLAEALTPILRTLTRH